MLTAVGRASPRFGARVKSFDVESVQGMRAFASSSRSRAAWRCRDELLVAKRVPRQAQDRMGTSERPKFPSADILAEFKRLAATARGAGRAPIRG
jgi:hypothetical protein